MVWIELRFPVIGTALPSDHGYAMYSAISRLVPEAHQADWLAVETVPGTARGDGGIHINERARLRAEASIDACRRRCDGCGSSSTRQSLLAMVLAMVSVSRLLMWWIDRLTASKDTLQVTVIKTLSLNPVLNARRHLGRFPKTSIKKVVDESRSLGLRSHRNEDRE